MKKKLPLFLFFIPALLFFSCNNTKYLAEGQYLYTGGKIEVKAGRRNYRQAEIRETLEGVMRPRPNRTLAGMRIRLWFYNIAGTPKKEKGLRATIKNKLGEPPVLLEKVLPETVSRVMVNRLYNMGHFNAEVTFREVKEKKRAHIVYEVAPKRPYRLDSVVYPLENGLLTTKINALAPSSLLKLGDVYSLENLKAERERIDMSLKEDGYYFFNPDYLLFNADSTVGGHRVRLYLRIKPGTPPQAMKPYDLGEIRIYPNYRLDSALAQQEMVAFRKPLVENPYLFAASDTGVFIPKKLLKFIVLEPGVRYRRSSHELTLNKLIGLENFKFVNIRFREMPDGLIDTDLFLTPLPRRNLLLEANAVAKSNQFAGPAFRLQVGNRNLFKGGERLSFNLRFGYEQQFGRDLPGFNAYEFGISTNLTIPRFLGLGARGMSGRYVPVTDSKLAYNIQDRLGYYRLSTVNGTFGYKWRETDKKSHELNIFSLSYVYSGNLSDEFTAILAQNPFLARSFINQFISSTAYSFTYNSKAATERKDYFYFNGQLEVAGNSLFLGNSLIAGETSTPDSPFQLVNGIPFAQFVKSTAEVVYHKRLGPKGVLATRLITGAAYSYGNSEYIPFVKQYFIGGVNSIRAFRARTLGPGAYVPDASLFLFLDQTGDIKLEGNIEYRHQMAGFLHGALFVDAGNIWSFRDDPVRNAGRFRKESFYKEIAIGTGVGLRLDFSYFLLRFDLAFPLRVPYFPENERWVFDKIAPGSPEWRRQNLVFNIGIGYPF